MEEEYLNNNKKRTKTKTTIVIEEGTLTVGDGGRGTEKDDRKGTGMGNAV